MKRRYLYLLLFAVPIVLASAVVAEHVDVAWVLAQAGADLSLRGTGAPGFADRTAHDLAVERGMRELAAALKPT